jgi:hypothetical protein
MGEGSSTGKMVDMMAEGWLMMTKGMGGGANDDDERYVWWC